MNKIVIRDHEFFGKSIQGGNCFISNSLPCDELTIDTLDAELEGSEVCGTLFIPKGSSGLLTQNNKLFFVRPYVDILVHDLSIYKFGEPVYFYQNETLIGKFFMKPPKRVAQSKYSISCVSAVGLLENSRHYGGIYNGEPLKTVIEDIIGGLFPYFLDETYKDTGVYGWLPVDSRRKNLHQTLFALGLSVFKTINGDPYFTALTESGRGELPDSQMFLGGNVEYSSITSAQVSEHAFFSYEKDQEATLFEGEVPADPILTPKGVQAFGTIVLFNEPMHDLSIQDGTILESGVNYAVVGQAANCVLIGKKYTHTVRVVSENQTQTRNIVEINDNEARITNATLVSFANSENVAKRVFSYYNDMRTSTTDIVVQNEIPGSPIRFNDPFGNPSDDGFIHSMDINFSELLRANATLVSGYVPIGIGNYYQNYVFIATSQTWVVPTECKGKIRAVLISGGAGGSSGAKGVDGQRARGSSYGKPGDGGLGGSHGSGGKILIVTIPTVAGSSFYAGIGTGGNGGIMAEDGTSIPGSEGSATTFGSYTSNNGQPSETGYINQISGEMYALSGEIGLNGGAGQPSSGEAETVEYNGVTYVSGIQGQSASAHGQRGAGGLGGGAAAGNNGGDGGDATAEDNEGHGFADGGMGGIGADAASGNNATWYGNGGQGGHGGGGGGGGGAVSGSDEYTWPGSGGDGGSGGAGGKGAPGCIIVYY